MPIESNCSGCGQRLRVDDAFAGRQARCPNCGLVYVVEQQKSRLGFLDETQVHSSGSGQNGMSEPASGDDQRLNQSYDSIPASIEPNSAKAILKEFFARTPDGTIYGPADLETLRRWFDEGRLNAACEFREGQTAAWQGCAALPSWIEAPSLNPFPSPGGSPSGRGFESPRLSESANSMSSPTVNPYADDPNIQVSTSITASGLAQGHGGVVLAMGISSWLLSCCYCGWIFALIGVAMGHSDMKAIRNGTMDPSQLGMTQVGFWLSLIHLILMVIGLVIGSILGFGSMFFN